MAPPHTDREIVDGQLWGGAMRCQRTRSKDFSAASYEVQIEVWTLTATLVRSRIETHRDKSNRGGRDLPSEVGRRFSGTERMAAAANNICSFCLTFAICTAIIAVRTRGTIAGRMRALFLFAHDTPPGSVSLERGLCFRAPSMNRQAPDPNPESNRLHLQDLPKAATAIPERAWFFPQWKRDARLMSAYRRGWWRARLFSMRRRL
jgi:hypothetical protein